MAIKYYQCTSDAARLCFRGGRLEISTQFAARDGRYVSDNRAQIVLTPGAKIRTGDLLVQAALEAMFDKTVGTTAPRFAEVVVDPAASDVDTTVFDPVRPAVGTR